MHEANSFPKVTTIKESGEAAAINQFLQKADKSCKYNQRVQLMSRSVGHIAGMSVQRLVHLEHIELGCGYSACLCGQLASACLKGTWNTTACAMHMIVSCACSARNMSCF